MYKPFLDLGDRLCFISLLIVLLGRSPWELNDGDGEPAVAQVLIDDHILVGSLNCNLICWHSCKKLQSVSDSIFAMAAMPVHCSFCF